METLLKEYNLDLLQRAAINATQNLHHKMCEMACDLQRITDKQTFRLFDVKGATSLWFSRVKEGDTHVGITVVNDGVPMNLMDCPLPMLSLIARQMHRTIVGA